MQRKAVVKSGEPILCEKASLSSSRYPAQNTSFLPTLLGGKKERDIAFQNRVMRAS